MLAEVHDMGRKKRRSYTAEFKVEAARLATQGDKPIREIARNIGVSESALRRWVGQLDIDTGKGPPGALTTEERAELTQLRREIRQIRMERDFLKKAAAFFARESS
jgi:transposase-like protein